MYRKGLQRNYFNKTRTNNWNDKPFNHLIRHQIIIERRNKTNTTENDEVPNKKAKTSILNFVKLESLREIFAKCVAVDNMSFKRIVQSEVGKGYVAS